MLRMRKKTRNIRFYHITDKAEKNNKCMYVCLDARWCLVSTCTLKRLEII